MVASESSESVERTADGRHIVVNGRRWRATDPNIPDSLRQELVNELMSARRAVKSAKSNPSDLAAVRERVNNAKIALGERGQPWWEDGTPEEQRVRATAAILALTTKRGGDSSICPSDAARIIASPDWRGAMDTVRSAGVELARQGRLEITQAGVPVERPDGVTGPIRYRLAART